MFRNIVKLNCQYRALYRNNYNFIASYEYLIQLSKLSAYIKLNKLYTGLSLNIDEFYVIILSNSSYISIKMDFFVADWQDGLACGRRPFVILSWWRIGTASTSPYGHPTTLPARFEARWVNNSIFIYFICARQEKSSDFKKKRFLDLVYKYLS